MIKNKKNIVLAILESKNKNCTEYLYFEFLNKFEKFNLNYNLIVYCFGNKPNENDILKIRFTKNIHKIILVKDNDLKYDIKKEIFKIQRDMKKILTIYKINADVELFGIPENKFSFDHFLLMHFDNKTFKNKKRNPQAFFKKEHDEKYKTNENFIKKILSIKDIANNLIFNSSCDKNYEKLVKIIFCEK